MPAHSVASVTISQWRYSLKALQMKGAWLDSEFKSLCRIATFSAFV
jgi:hypothetical protein